MAESYAATAQRALSARDVSPRDALRLARAVLRLQCDLAELRAKFIEVGEAHTAASALLLAAKRERDQARLELAALRERFGQAVADAVAEARVTDQQTIANLEFKLALATREGA